MYFLLAILFCILINKICEYRGDSRSLLYITNLFILAGLIIYKIGRLFHV